jgi:hypothetical protein
VSTAGGDEAVIRDQIRQQEQDDKRLDPIGPCVAPTTVKVVPNWPGATATGLAACSV